MDALDASAPCTVSGRFERASDRPSRAEPGPRATAKTVTVRTAYGRALRNVFEIFREIGADDGDEGLRPRRTFGLGEVIGEHVARLTYRLHRLT